jgi:hypothetical protein
MLAALAVFLYSKFQILFTVIAGPVILIFLTKKSSFLLDSK